ncbi:MAG: hypothetical protein Q8P81_03835 [Nanoarchaeota archaeon]|nr:hypothetical protein [Nanoarchaeota archaeon]
MTIAYKVGRSKIPTLLHGTAVESVIELISEGKTKSPTEIGAPWRHEERGFMYFFPLRSGIKGHWLEGPDNGSQRDNYQRVKGYAQLNQYGRFIRDNQIPEPAKPFSYCEVDDWLMGNINGSELKRLLKRDCPNIEDIFRRDDWQKARQHLKHKRGVVIELNKKALQLDLYSEDEFGNGAGEVKAYLPEGLSLEYVHRIIPCGRLEEQAIDETLEAHPIPEIRKVKIRLPSSN